MRVTNVGLASALGAVLLPAGELEGARYKQRRLFTEAAAT